MEEAVIMTKAEPPQDLSARIENFIKAFFGDGNVVWSDRDPNSPSGQNVAPFLQILRVQSEVPVVLPRRVTVGAELSAYVIAFDNVHAAAVAELLTAFVGPSFSTFDGLPARLDPADPVERAIIDLVGENVTFKLTSPTTQTQFWAWEALSRLQATMKLRPVRTWHAPKPVGRLLAEFDVALAAGDNSASLEILDRLTASGGLSAANLAHLRIKRLAKLGRDAELLRLPGLRDVVVAGAPAPVRDAVLAAIYTSLLAAPLTAGDLPQARDLLIEDGELVPALLSEGLADLSPEALTVAALAAFIRSDSALLRQIGDNPQHRASVAGLAPILSEAIGVSETAEESTAGGQVPTTEPTPAQETQSAAEPTPDPPDSWPALIDAIEADATDVVMTNETWREWSAPVTTDREIAGRLARLDDQAAERAWTVVGPFLDADGYNRPAAASARELLGNALAYGRFGPGDLAGVVALTEIFLRSGPEQKAYADLLDDLNAECNRWAGPDRAMVVLDLVDLLARAACPDTEARLRLAQALLRPLRDHRTRLAPELVRFAGQLSGELQTGLEWPVADADQASDGAATALSPAKVLLYSLDEGVLKRTAELLAALVPGIDVRLSHDRVNTSRLESQLRGIDVIVIATRCAKHAATGAIRGGAPARAVIAEADGSGSASLFRAAVAALRSRQQQ
jgi:hypothetical protein